MASHSQEQRGLIAIAGLAYSLLTKASDIVDTVSAYNDRLSFLVGLVTTSSSDVSAETIKALHNQIKAMDTYMKSAFKQVIFGIYASKQNLR